MSVEQELRAALTEFMRAAAEKNNSAVAAALARVGGLQQQLGPDAPPMLRHYLERRSYQKALDLLNSGRPETETPQCGH
jgi:Flp pilus assembly protein TadD